MIITRANTGSLWEPIFREWKDLTEIRVTAVDLRFKFEWSGERSWSYAEIEKDSSLARWLTRLWELMPEVCTEHKRFAPCRNEDGPYGCRYSVEPEDVETVRRWQGEGGGEGV